MVWNGRFWSQTPASNATELAPEMRADAGPEVPAGTAPAEPITGQAQWQRLSGVLQASIGASETACRLQSEAADQIDAAQYALQRMLDELTSVLPQAAAPSRQPATAPPVAEIPETPASTLAA